MKDTLLRVRVSLRAIGGLLESLWELKRLDISSFYPLSFLPSSSPLFRTRFSLRNCGDYKVACCSQLFINTVSILLEEDETRTQEKEEEKRGRVIERRVIKNNTVI